MNFKMEAGKKFEKVILEDLSLPNEILHIFEGEEFDIASLINITKDELTSILNNATSNGNQRWNTDEIFNRIISWREINGFKVFGFAEVIVEEKWSEQSQDPDIDQDSQSGQSELAESVDISTGELKVNQELATSVIVSNIIKHTLTHQQPDPPITALSNFNTHSRPHEVKDHSATSAQSSSKTAQQTEPSASNWPSQSVSSSSHSEETKPLSRIYVAPNHFSPNVLVNILSQTVVGLHILERALHGPLSKDSKRELVGIIADYHCEKGFPLVEDVLRRYADAITAQFKYEKADTYFIARGGIKKNHGGKLYNRISNLRQKTTKRRLNEEHYLATVSKKHTEPPNVVEDTCVKDAVIWLEQNSKPWATVLGKWAASFKARKVQLAKPNSGPNLLKRYQLYTDKNNHNKCI